jgi:TRAP-type C4-dicarboxylate transport system permease small subunit
LPGVAAPRRPGNDQQEHAEDPRHTMNTVRRIYDRILEMIAALMMAVVALMIVAGFVFRWAGESLVWYDEVAAIALCWLTYYAGALAALRGAHIGFPGLVNALPANLRVAATLLASAITIFFFALLAWTGFQVVNILKGDTLVSIPEVSLQVTQSVIPITSVLFVIAELIRLPELLREAHRGPLIDHEIKEALESVGIEPIATGGKERQP